VSSIVKQPSGSYLVRFRDPNGRSRCRAFPTLNEARRFEKSIEGDIVRGDYVDPAGQRSTFEAWAATWWETTIKLRPSTRRGYRGLLDRHVLPYFGGLRLGAIDYGTVELFIADRLKVGLSPKVVRECVSVVSLIMRTAQRSNARRDNPAAGHSVPSPRKRIGEGDVLDMPQLLRLVENVRDPYKPAVWLLALTGIRPAELCGLRVRDVDLTRGLVHVRATMMPVHKFGDVPYRMVEGPPKTDAGDRVIPIPEWLCTDLAAMLAERASGPVDRAGFLFQTRYGNPVNRDHFRENVIRPALRAAGLPESIRTYDLRHSHASLLIDLGANPLAIAQRMGHSDATVTLRVYGHLFEGTQAKLSDQLDGLRAAATTQRSFGAVPIPIRRPGR
jgi:integrase